MIHELKIWPDFFASVATGAKTFEIRKTDRNYAVGDILILREWEPLSKCYTGKDITRKVTYVMDINDVPAVLCCQYVVILGLAAVAQEVDNGR